MLDSCHLIFCSIISDFVCISLGWTVCLKEVQFQNAYEKSECMIKLNIGEIHYHIENKTNGGKQIEFSAESNQFEEKNQKWE